METGDANVHILVEAKNEYTQMLCSTIVPHVYTTIEQLYKTNKQNGDIRQFQNALGEIPKWNQDTIDEKLKYIIQSSKCDRECLDDLMTAVFITNTKILTVIKINNRNIKKKKPKFHITIPKLNHFIHRVYIETARLFYMNPLLIDREDKTNYELQQIMRESIRLIKDAIKSAIRKFIPLKDILKHCLNKNLNQNESESEQEGGDEPEEPKEPKEPKELEELEEPEELKEPEEPAKKPE